MGKGSVSLTASKVKNSKNKAPNTTAKTPLILVKTPISGLKRQRAFRKVSATAKKLKFSVLDCETKDSMPNSSNYEDMATGSEPISVEVLSKLLTKNAETITAKLETRFDSVDSSLKKTKRKNL